MNDPDVLSEKIINLLKVNPGGLSISDISHTLKIHRNSASKYLEILQKTGLVDLRLIGNSKVYYPGQSVPISAILGYTKEGILILDNRDSIIQVNDRFCHMFGLEKNVIRSGHLSNLPPFIYRRFTLNPDERTYKDFIPDKDCLHHLEMPDHSGSNRLIKVNILNTLLDSGKSGRVIIFEDITDKREIEHSRNTAYVHLKNSFEHIGVPAFIFDMDRDILVWNRAMEILTGCSAEEIIGTQNLIKAYSFFAPYIPVLADIFHLSVEDRIKKYPDVVKMGDNLLMEAVIPKFRGDFDVLIWAKLSPLFDENGNILGMIQIFKDMTNWKKNSSIVNQYSKKH